MAGKKALLIIDMLNDFVGKGAPLEVPNINSIIEPIKKEIEKAKVQGFPIIYLCDSHETGDREFEAFPAHAVKNTKGAKIIEEMKPEGNDIIVLKNTYSGFHKTELEGMLERLSVDWLILTGCVTNICVLYTAADAVMRNYRVDVVKDAVIGLNQEDHQFGLDQMKNILKVNII
jgi:nicotinamidase-related amidase